MALTAVVEQLREEQGRLQSELDRVTNALSALNGSNGRRGRKPGRHMSASARARIGAAKKAWWAKRKRAKN